MKKYLAAAAALFLAHFACHARGQEEGSGDDLDKAVRELMSKLDDQRAVAKERGCKYLARQKAVAGLVEESAEQVASLVDDKGMPYVRGVAERLGRETRRAKKLGLDDVHELLQDAEISANSSIPKLKSFSEVIIAQLNNVSETAEDSQGQAKSLVQMWLKSLKHEGKEVLSTMKGAKKEEGGLQDAKAKTTKEYPKLSKLELEIAGITADASDKVQIMARSGRRFSLGAIVALNNAIEKLEKVGEHEAFRRELQDHENSIWEVDLELHRIDERIARKLSKESRDMKRVWDFGARFERDFLRWMEGDLERVRHIIDLIPK